MDISEICLVCVLVGKMPGKMFSHVGRMAASEDKSKCPVVPDMLISRLNEIDHC